MVAMCPFRHTLRHWAGILIRDGDFAATATESSVWPVRSQPAFFPCSRMDRSLSRSTFVFNPELRSFLIPSRARHGTAGATRTKVLTLSRAILTTVSFPASRGFATIAPMSPNGDRAVRSIANESLRWANLRSFMIACSRASALSTATFCHPPRAMFPAALWVHSPNARSWPARLLTPVSRAINASGTSTRSKNAGSPETVGRPLDGVLYCSMSRLRGGVVAVGPGVRVCLGDNGGATGGFLPAVPGTIGRPGAERS